MKATVDISNDELRDEVLHARHTAKTLLDYVKDKPRKEVERGDNLILARIQWLEERVDELESTLEMVAGY